MYISFDYDHDLELKNNIVAQSQKPDAPFRVKDMSIQYELTYKWKKYARKKIRNCDVMIVLCGINTHNAQGVSAEISIAQEEKTPYFLLDGRQGKGVKPKGVFKGDKMHRWTWKNLKRLVEGER